MDEVRALPKFTGLLLVTGVRPARIRLVPWMDGPNAVQIHRRRLWGFSVKRLVAPVLAALLVPPLTVAALGGALAAQRAADCGA